MWDLLGLQLIGDKVQGGEKGEGIKDGESLEWGGGVDGQHVYPSNDRQADMQEVQRKWFGDVDTEPSTSN